MEDCNSTHWFWTIRIASPFISSKIRNCIHDPMANLRYPARASSWGIDISLIWRSTRVYKPLIGGHFQHPFLSGIAMRRFATTESRQCHKAIHLPINPLTWLFPSSPKHTHQTCEEVGCGSGHTSGGVNRLQGQKGHTESYCNVTYVPENGVYPQR